MKHDPWRLNIHENDDHQCEYWSKAVYPVQLQYDVYSVDDTTQFIFVQTNL